MRRIKYLGALALAAGLCLAAASPAADEEKKGDRKGGDRNFVEKASASGLAEVNLGRIAANQSANQAVRDFGRHLVEQHARANEQLNQLANRAGIKPADSMDQKHTTAMRQMVNLQGAAFDRAFVKQMVEDHEKAIKLFEDESKNGKNAALKDFAKKTLPTLKEHLKMAKDLRTKLGGSGEKKGTTKPRDEDK